MKTPACLLAVLFAAGCTAGVTEPAAPPSPPAAPTGDPDFPRKSPTRPGDWLDVHRERGQTVEQYKQECLNRKREGRETIVIQPLGGILDRHADVIEQVRTYVAAFYDCSAEVAKPLPMPEDTYVAKRRQHDADRLLVDLRNRVEGRMLAYVGFCEEDLYSGLLNFVFGLGSLHQRAGVYSLARYGGKEERRDGAPIFLKRTLKVATHEIGHMLGMEHCIRYECNMNGSNSVAEMDREPMHLCPECQEKAEWCTGFEPKKRYAALAAFYRETGLTADAAFAERQAGKREGGVQGRDGR